MKSAQYEKWPWWLVLAFAAGLAYANLAQAVRGVVSAVRSFR